MRSVRLFGLLVTTLFLPACPIGLFGDGDSDGDDDDDDSNGANGFVSATDGATAGWTGDTAGGWDSGDQPTTTGIEMTGADNEPEAGCPCAEGTELVYVLSDVGSLWSFDPKSGAFAFIADIHCGGMTETYSMGVSRKGRAWIQYWNGDLYTVDLNDASDPVECKDPGFVPDNPMFPQFGMAFVANSLNDPCDKLYAHSGISPDLQGPDVGALGVIDPQTLKLSTIAGIDYAWGELTGTGTGRLFAFQGSSPALLTEYDKATGDIIDVLPLPGLQSESAFAFAWWGGDFYLFTSTGDFVTNSEVWHLDFDNSDDSDQALTLLTQAPIRIVGAGVSTCAPPLPM
ncbi:hypothetical protein [Nannocystis pusilla]|uniref:hypothetical protein n=1 Tax=Nannocystis pusilla TaxID=889268 RepID=UPI003BF1E36D